VVQINPGTVSGSTKEIRRGVWDRHNQLAGNLSLNQELSFVDDIIIMAAWLEATAVHSVGEADARHRVPGGGLGATARGVIKAVPRPQVKGSAYRPRLRPGSAFLVVRDFFLDGWKSAKGLDSGLAKQVRRLSRTFHFRSQPSTEDVRFRRLEKEGADAWHVEADWF
jgi:hypothetical protein